MKSTVRDFFVISCTCLQCVHLSEVYYDVDPGAAGRFHPWIQTGVPVAVLALLRECVYHFPLPRAGENPPVWFHLLCSPMEQMHCIYSNECFFSLQVICVVFVCAAFTLDIFCLIFVPLHWLFFVASTYVLFNYIWHTGEHMNCSSCAVYRQTWAAWTDFEETDPWAKTGEGLLCSDMFDCFWLCFFLF